ncbi:MAG: hypothetical protein EA360_06555 [Balneolaceae bacterium]|nr:MAG: hypothetical protein EA360_06555 [Balneolaceae bacterium]
MNIHSINANTSMVNNQRTGSKNELGQQQFLQLLVAQMRNQDPINPLDGAEFASQLAQFNSVEQLISVNQGLKSLQESQDLMSASLNNSMAATLTGKQAKVMTNEIHLSDGEPVHLKFELQTGADEIEVIIRNASGSEVRRETIPGMPSGENEWSWDGKNDAGATLFDGTYTVELKAKSSGSPVSSMMFLEGVVEKVRFTGDGVFLSVNNIQVPIGDVQEIRNTPKEI